MQAIIKSYTQINHINKFLHISRSWKIIDLYGNINQ